MNHTNQFETESSEFNTKWPPRQGRLVAPLVPARHQQLLHRVLFPIRVEKHSALHWIDLNDLQQRIQIRTPRMKTPIRSILVD